MCVKAEYDLSRMKKTGHPLRKKINSGEIKLINPFDICDRELDEKLATLGPDEQDFIKKIRGKLDENT